MLYLTVASLDRPFVSAHLLNTYYTFDVCCDVPSLIGFSAVPCLKFAACVLSLRIRTLTCRRLHLLLRVRPIVFNYVYFVDIDGRTDILVVEECHHMCNLNHCLLVLSLYFGNFGLSAFILLSIGWACIIIDVN